jgi:hypothetical protein
LKVIIEIEDSTLGFLGKDNPKKPFIQSHESSAYQAFGEFY